MLIIGLGSIALAIFILSIIFLERNGWDSNNGWWFGFVFALVALLTVTLTVAAIYTSNATRIAELKAFEEVNIQNYATAVTETRVILSSEEFMGKVVAGSLEKTEVGKSISQRIAEWRDEANKFNIEVAGKQITRTLWFYPGWMIMPAEVNDLKLLTIK